MSRLHALEKRSLVSAPPVDSTASDRATEQIVGAIQSLRTVSSHNYYISNFDPSIHDVDTWFAEVNRAKLVNRWDDYECLSRIGNCLKGDAKVWLNEWVSNDRSWTNFQHDFKPLCCRKIDVANILYEVMSTDSDSFRTYADYARKSLLRLRIVNGLTDALITAIVIRGIKDPHVKATATNANLSSDELVNYLSTFIKPTKPTDTRSTRHNLPSSSGKQNSSYRPNFSNRCLHCKQTGHRLAGCPNRSNLPAGNNEGRYENRRPNVTCTYCKKTGHDISICHAKQRTEQRNQNKGGVNFCSAVQSNCSDIVVAVIQGIPVDILIDSGAIGVSLISESVVKYFACKHKQIGRAHV